MKRIANAFLIFALATVKLVGAAAEAKTAEAAKREVNTGADSNLAETPLPQLSANPGTVPEVPMARETNLFPGSTVAPPAPAQPRNPWWMILAVLAVLAGSSLLKRWRARVDRS